jgi:1-acyl-sn-glycerol-3-phosphate acyltransferase
MVPVTINGAFNALPKGFNYIIPGTIEMIIHSPIDTSNLNNENLNEMVNHVKNIIQTDLNL